MHCEPVVQKGTFLTLARPTPSTSADSKAIHVRWIASGPFIGPDSVTHPVKLQAKLLVKTDVCLFIYLRLNSDGWTKGFKLI